MKQKIYLPTRLQYVLLPVLTVLLLVLANTQLIRERLSSGAGGMASSNISAIGRYLDSDVVSSIGVFVFWLFVGAGAYALIGMLVLIVHPLIPMAHVRQAVGHRSTKKAQQISHLLFTRFILRTVAAACLIVWVAANVSFALQFIDEAAREFIRSGNVIMGLSAVVIGAIDMFLVVLIVRLMVLRDRLL
jgi:hypothetical protein